MRSGKRFIRTSQIPQRQPGVDEMAATSFAKDRYNKNTFTAATFLISEIKLRLCMHYDLSQKI
jgi:hypothetical protein